MFVEEHCRHIVDSLESGEPATLVSAYLDSLQSSVQQQVITSIRTPPLGITPIKLFRALWCSVPLRPRILTVFAATAPREVTGRETQLLDEVEVLLGEDTIDLNVPESARLRSITLCATALSKAAARNPFAHHGPLLIFCARAAGRMGTKRGLAVQTRIMKFVLIFLQAPGNLRLASIAVLLEEDLQLSFADETLLIKAVDTFTVLKCKERELPALFRTLLTALSRASTKRLINVLGRLALHVLHVAKTDMISELLMILGVSFVESDQVCPRILEALSDLINGRERFETLNCKCVRLGISHASVLYYMLGSSSSHGLRKAIGNLLEQIAEDESISFATPHIASSSSDAGDPEHWRKIVLSRSLDIPEVCTYGEAITEYFESQIWTLRPNAQKWGARLLVEVFSAIPHVRKKILAAIFSAVTSEGTPESVVKTFCSILEQLCSSNRSAFLMKDCGESLLDLLKYIENVPIGYDSSIAVTVVKLGISIPSLQDGIFLFLQKVTGSRFWKLQRIAGAGLVTIIEHPSASDRARDEACMTIGKLLEVADISVRTYITFLLTQLLERDPHQYSRISRVSEAIVKRALILDPSLDQELSRSTVSSAESHSSALASSGLDFARNFQLIGGEWSPKDNIPVLLRFCVRVKSKERRVEEFLQKFMDYMGDAGKAIVDVCKQQDSSLSVYTQIQQLCSLYESALCFGLQKLSVAHIQAYSLSLLICNFLDSKEQVSGTGTKTKQERASGKLDGSTVFAATMARSSACSEATVLRAQRDFRPSLQSYITALEYLIGFDVKSLLIQVVISEVMSHVFARINSRLDSDKEYRLAPDQADRLLEISKTCFSVACPWNRNLECDSVGELESMVDSDETTLTLTEPRIDKGSNSDQFPLSASNTDSRPFSPQEINLEYEDARKAIEPTRLRRQEAIVQASLRQFAFKIFLAVLTTNSAVDLWAKCFSFLKDVYESSETQVPHTVKLTTTTSFDKRKAQGQTESPVKTVEAAVAVFYNEVAHIFHPPLALSYINLFQRFLSASKNPNEDKRVKEVIKETVLKLLREYVITNQKVLRGMLLLLTKCFDRRSGAQFSAELLCWLGHDECLLNSQQATREEDRDTFIGVDSFDIDILEEAISYDADEELADDLQDQESGGDDLAQLNESRSTESANLRNQGQHASCIDTSMREKAEEENSVRSLCLNENKDTGNISFNCFLNYLGSLLRDSVEAHRKWKGEEGLRRDDLLLVSDIVSALEGFFSTPLAEMKTSRSSRMSLSIRRKVSSLLLALIEIVSCHLNVLGKSIMSMTKGISQEHQSIIVTKQILELLCNENVENLLEFVYQWDQGSRCAFLQENLDATASAFLAGVETEKKDVTEICSMLRSRAERRARRKEAARNLTDDDMENISKTQLGLHPAKKQRIRSRNKQVDEWLRDERGDDNFADLEDFVVPMDASDL